MICLYYAVYALILIIGTTAVHSAIPHKAIAKPDFYALHDIAPLLPLSWCTCAPDALRMNMILAQVAHLTTHYPPDILNQAHEPIVHTEFGETGGKQTALLGIALALAGYEKIHLYIITGPETGPSSMEWEKGIGLQENAGAIGNSILEACNNTAALKGLPAHFTVKAYANIGRLPTHQLIDTPNQRDIITNIWEVPYLYLIDYMHDLDTQNILHSHSIGCTDWEGLRNIHYPDYTESSSNVWKEHAQSPHQRIQARKTALQEHNGSLVQYFAQLYWQPLQHKETHKKNCYLLNNLRKKRNAWISKHANSLSTEIGVSQRNAVLGLELSTHFCEQFSELIDVAARDGKIAVFEQNVNNHVHQFKQNADDTGWSWHTVIMRETL